MIKINFVINSELDLSPARFLLLQNISSAKMCQEI